MKKYQSIGLAIGLSLLVLPVIALAEGEDRQNANTPNPLRAQIEQKRQELNNMRPPKIGSSTEDRRPPMFGSTTRPFPPGFSSTTRQEIKQERQDVRDARQQQNQERKELRLDIFKLRQENVTKQLTRAIDNLKQIRERIDARITKSEQAGRDMTAAKALLATADVKISAAEAAVNLVAAFVPPTGTSTPGQASSTGDMANLDKPRVMANGAIQATKDARDALNNVVVSIAQSMGLKLGTQ